MVLAALCSPALRGSGYEFGGVNPGRCIGPLAGKGKRRK